MRKEEQGPDPAPTGWSLLHWSTSQTGNGGGLSLQKGGVLEVAGYSSRPLPVSLSKLFLPPGTCLVL